MNTASMSQQIGSIGVAPTGTPAAHVSISSAGVEVTTEPRHTYTVAEARAYASLLEAAADRAALMERLTVPEVGVRPHWPSKPVDPQRLKR